MISRDLNDVSSAYSRLSGVTDHIRFSDSDLRVCQLYRAKGWLHLAAAATDVTHAGGVGLAAAEALVVDLPGGDPALPRAGVEAAVFVVAALL